MVEALVLVFNRWNVWNPWSSAACNHTCLDGITILSREMLQEKKASPGFTWKTQWLCDVRGPPALCKYSFQPIQEIMGAALIRAWKTLKLETSWNIIPLHSLPFARRRLLPLFVVGRGMAATGSQHCALVLCAKSVPTLGPTLAVLSGKHFNVFKAHCSAETAAVQLQIRSLVICSWIDQQVVQFVVVEAPNVQQIYVWLVVWTPLKNISQLGWLFPIYGENKKWSKPPTQIC